MQHTIFYLRQFKRKINKFGSISTAAEHKYIMNLLSVLPGRKELIERTFNQ